MKSESKKHKVSDECMEKRDRLSELPNEVLVHILSYLPTLDAVRTVMIPGFGKLWTLVESLELVDYEYDELGSDDEEYCDDTALYTRFKLFVHNVLMHYKRPTMQKFLLFIQKDMDWEYEAESAVADVEGWIEFALSREVKELKLDFGESTYFPLRGSIFMSQSLVRLRGSIFMSQSLVRLTLQNCKIEVPSRVHMGSLRNLEIVNVRVNDKFSEFFVDVRENDKFDEFLSGCPSLKDLVINNSNYVGALRSQSIEKLVYCNKDPRIVCTIDYPYLKILKIDVILDYVEIVNIPSIREVTVSSYVSDDEEDAHLFKRISEGLQNVEALTSMWEVDLPLAYYSMVNVGFRENRWKRVVLHSSFENTRVAGICCLVKNSPCLEELVIHETDAHHSTWDDMLDASELFCQEALSPCLAPQLKVVSLHGYA